jgi:Zn-dependent membrane protease YugP
MSQDYMMYYLLAGVLTLIGMYVNRQLKSRFNKYSQIANPQRLSGAEISRTMLEHYGIYDVTIVEGKGTLTDHYNPLTKTVSLSPPVYRGHSVMSAAVAAHECGHAVQHAEAYAFLKFRSAMVPLVKSAAVAQQWLLLIALMVAGAFPQLLLIVIASFAITTTFSMLTLPVEFDASKRALVWLRNSGVTQGDSYYGAKDALKWAAMTYVTAALSSLAMLVFLLLRYMGARD